MGAVKSEILREKPLGQISGVWSRPGQKAGDFGGRKGEAGMVCERYVCTYTASQGCMWRGPLVKPWSPEAEGTHLGEGLGRLGRKLSWKWFRPQSPHPVGGAVKGPGCPGAWQSGTVLLTPGVTVLKGQKWSSSSGGRRWPKARRWGQSCQNQDQEASLGRRFPSSSISSRRRRPAS